jgi:hypothetical protein
MSNSTLPAGASINDKELYILNAIGHIELGSVEAIIDNSHIAEAKKPRSSGSMHSIAPSENRLPLPSGQPWGLPRQ